MSVDMWCLGVLAYELLVGRAPFYHISRKETIRKIVSVEWGQEQEPQGVSKEAKAFIEGLLRKRAEERMGPETVLKHPFLQRVAADSLWFYSTLVVDFIVSFVCNFAYLLILTTFDSEISHSHSLIDAGFISFRLALVESVFQFCHLVVL